MKLTKEGIAVAEVDNYLSKDIEREGRLDVAQKLVLGFRPYIPEGGVVADVGACLGDYTMTFSQMVGPNGKVYAFEPHAPAWECLCYNMAGYSNVVLLDVALGAENEWGTFERDFHNLGASQVHPDKNGNVRIRPLDVIAKRWTRLDFLKIDAEGFEPMILDGSRETIMRLRPVIYIEVSQYNLNKLNTTMSTNLTTEDIYRRLEALEYVFKRTDGHDGDILCLPKERV